MSRHPFSGPGWYEFGQKAFWAERHRSVLPDAIDLFFLPDAIDLFHRPGERSCCTMAGDFFAKICTGSRVADGDVSCRAAIEGLDPDEAQP